METLVLLLVVLGLFILIALASFFAFIAIRSKTHEQIRPHQRPSGPHGPQPYVGELANEGEAKVHYVLASLFPESNYSHLISGVYLRSKKGRLPQIDHILINERGVFVIETKDWNGVVRGAEQDDEWIQIREDGSEEHLKNPLNQNAYHARAVKDWVSSITDPIAVVIMVKNNKPFNTYDSDSEDERVSYLINFDEMREFFLDFDPCLSPDQIETCRRNLMSKITMNKGLHSS